MQGENTNVVGLTWFFRDLSEAGKKRASYSVVLRLKSWGVVFLLLVLGKSPKITGWKGRRE